MALNPTTAFRVTEASQVAEPRRVVLWLASRVALSEQQTGRAAIVLTELATNLAKHARGGEILINQLYSPSGDPAGLEILALDKGPGIPDVALSRRDGYSTSGTLGHGLGAIERQSDSFELYTHGSGTIIAARIWREPTALGHEPSRVDVGGVLVSKDGEPVCGDTWGWRMRRDRLALIVADGLGHGLAAHEAASAARDVFARYHESAPGRLLEDIHAALKPTRGAAVACAAIDLERGVVTYAGLGNIAGAVILANGRRHNMVSHNGTAGHTAGRIQEFHYPLPAGALLVLCSDGLNTHWDVSGYPGLRTRGPSVIAGTLYRDFSRRRDDATVVVVKERAARPDAGS